MPVSEESGRGPSLKFRSAKCFYSFGLDTNTTRLSTAGVMEDLRSISLSSRLWKISVGMPDF
jgi:hypothetical protein